MKRLIFTMCLIVWPALAQAQPLPPELSAAPDETAFVTEVVDGDTLILSSGKQVRLVGIQAPKLPLGRPHFEKWPLADEAKQALIGLAQSKRVTPHYAQTRMDRHERRLAHLQTANGVWLQYEMLKLGMARVYSFKDNRMALAPLLQAERQARAARRGIWADPYYAVRDAHALARGPIPVGQFLLVEGRVHAVTHRYEQTYINFEEDWRRDFSVEVKSRDRRFFATKTGDEQLALSELVGQHIRVRGWVSKRNGPMMRITHPEQIELLDR